MAKALTDQQVEAFRDALCVAATQLFAESGYRGMTLRGLAEVLGCSRQAPYRFFRNKEAIFAEVYARCYATFVRYCEDGSRNLTDPKAVILAVRDAYLRFAQDEPAAYRVVFGMRPPEGHPEVMKQIDKAARRLSRIFDQAAEAGVLRGEPDTQALIFWSMLHGMVSLDMLGSFKTAGGIERLAEALPLTIFKPEAIERQRRPRARAIA